MKIFDDFKKAYDPHWTQVTTGGGQLEISNSILRMFYESAQKGKYTDAQIDDYTMLSKSKYLWKPPLKMEVRARFSHPSADVNSTDKSVGVLKGTAGFGFWNKPFSMQGNVYTMPESVWFFYSAPPSNMSLVPKIPGWGWKAQVVHAMRPGAAIHSIPLSATALLARVSGYTQPAQYFMQKFAGASESLIAEDMTKWHTYLLVWRKEKCAFWVDNKLILETSLVPTRPLGFVAWLDNEFAVATPKGELRFGSTTSGPQWLDVDYVRIKNL